MNSGGESPRNAQEIQQFFDKERLAQEHMDSFYRGVWPGISIDRTRANKKWDLILLLKGTERRTIEEKFRFGVSFRDVLVEVVQDVVSGSPGWFSYADCDYVHYVFCTEDATPTRLYRIRWRGEHGFKKWYSDHLAEQKKATAIISPKGYGLTINLSVAWQDIPEDIITIIDIEPPD